MSSNAPIVDVAQALINWTLHGVQCQNQLYYRSFNPPITMTQLIVLEDRLNFAFRFNFKNTLGAGTVLRSIELRDRSPGSTLSRTLTINSATTNPINALPGSIALGLKHWVITPTDLHPSRSFVLGIPENRVTGNMLDPTWAEATRALWATNTALPGSFGWRYSRVSLYLAGAPRAVGVASDINGTVLQSLRVSNQRRRFQ